MLEQMRHRYYCGRSRGPVRRLLLSRPQPTRTPIREARLLALDLELTGLDPKRAEVISVGFVPIDGLRVHVSGARRLLVRPNGDVSASAHVHLLRDEDLESAGTIDHALEAVLDALEGRALLVHYAGLDHTILSRLCRERWDAPLLVPIVDTLALAYRRARRIGVEPSYHSFRLPALRARYGLPVAPMHGALSDALATAELFLAMVADGGLQARLRDFCC